MKCAPVLIPTMNRIDHLKACVESLKENRLAKETTLYIAVDYPKGDEYFQNNVDIRKYVSTINGFRNVVMISRPTSFGPGRNLYEAQEDIFLKYDSLIIIEDDNILSKNFLEYMNGGLASFRERDDISAICGYKHPIEIPSSYKDNYYLYRGFSGWGYGVWRDKPIKYRYTTEDLSEFLRQKKSVDRLRAVSRRHYFNVLETVLNNQERLYDFAVFLYNCQYDKYCVFPIVTKVSNNGFDGTGVNCPRMKTKANDQPFDESDTFSFSSSDVRVDPKITEKLKNYFTDDFLHVMWNLLVLVRYYLRSRFNSVGQKND